MDKSMPFGAESVLIYMFAALVAAAMYWLVMAFFRGDRIRSVSQVGSFSAFIGVVFVCTNRFYYHRTLGEALILGTIDAIAFLLTGLAVRSLVADRQKRRS